MNIAIDIRVLKGHLSGVGYYVRNLSRALISQDKINNYFFLTNEREPSFLKDIPIHRGPVLLRTFISNENHILGDLWENTILPLRMAWKIDIFHGPAFLTPLLKIGYHTVATVYDLIAFLFPDNFPFKYGLYIRNLLKLVTKKVDKIIAVSNNTKSDLINLLNIPEEKIEVVYGAADERFYPITDKEALEAVRRRYGINKNVILFVGNLEPRKNLPKLFEAYYILKEKIGKDYEIVVCGERKWAFNLIKDSIKKYDIEDSIIFTGYVPDEDMPFLYNIADLFVFPSLYEGFGLPVLEAMKCGIPTVASNTSSIPEIASDAALLVNPNDAEEIADTIYRLITDSALREKKITAGMVWAKGFSWEKSAIKMIKVYEGLRG